MDALYHPGPPEPRVYICSNCGEEHVDYGDMPPCMERTKIQALEDRIRWLEGELHVAQLQLLYAKKEREK